MTRTPGYNKDFITAQGITDAFRDAELCATAIDEAFAGARSFAVADTSLRDLEQFSKMDARSNLRTLQPAIRCRSVGTVRA